MNEIDSYSILITENCNLSCKYCYELLSGGHNNNVMTEETAIAAVEFMFKTAQHSNEIKVSLFGGEPTLMPDIIDTICSHGKKLAKKYNKKFYVGIITNATIMNQKLYSVFEKHMDIWSSTQLSIDGPEDIHDEYRVTKDGHGSFKFIEKNYPIWKELFGNKLNIHGVLNKKSISRLFESFLFFRENWGEEKLWFIPSKSLYYDINDVISYDKEMGKITDYIIDRCKKENSDREAREYNPLNRLFVGGSSSKPCGAGDNYCTITANGSIWPCHQFYFADENKEMLLGNIYDGINESRKRIWEEYDSSDIIGCEGCEHKQCFRCIAENYEVYGSPFVQIRGLHCDFMKVDMKYQKILKEELIKMGLLNKLDENQNSCDVVHYDCVGKIEECSNEKDNVDETEVIEDRFITQREAKEYFTEMLDDIITVLVKYHTILQK